MVQVKSQTTNGENNDCVVISKKLVEHLRDNMRGILQIGVSPSVMALVMDTYRRLEDERL
jgi:hypothetical protein